MLRGLLGADLIGFHTYDYERHFLSSVRRLLGHEVSFNEIHLEGRVVKVDSFPDEDFTGLVVKIADQAEYTPRNVSTQEGRRTTVFAVKLAIKNLDGRLKPGMPADIYFDR